MGNPSWTTKPPIQTTKWKEADRHFQHLYDLEESLFGDLLLSVSKLRPLRPPTSSVADSRPRDHAARTTYPLVTYSRLKRISWNTSAQHKRSNVCHYVVVRR